MFEKDGASSGTRKVFGAKDRWRLKQRAARLSLNIMFRWCYWCRDDGKLCWKKLTCNWRKKQARKHKTINNGKRRKNR